MDHKNLQEIVNKVFTEAFISTPLTKRLEDISCECRELCNYSNLINLKEETGDLLASLIQLCNESGWDIADLIMENEAKIKRRMLQYKGRGRKTQVAIIGGAFNPITLGHVKLAEFILKAARWADEVWFLPAYNHLDGKKMIEPHHRLQMLNLATKNDGRIKIFDYEIKHQLHGETYHFLNKLIHDNDYENYRFSFVIGMDRANTISTWFNFEELLKMDVPFIVSPRAGSERNSSVNWYLKAPHIYINDEENFLIEKTSSSEVRALLFDMWAAKNEGQSCELIKMKLLKSLNPDVLDYIEKNNLYKNE